MGHFRLAMEVWHEQCVRDQALSLHIGFRGNHRSAASSVRRGFEAAASY